MTKDPSELDPSMTDIERDTDADQCPDTTTLCQLHDDPNPRSLHQTSIILDHIHIRPSGGIHELLEQCDLLLNIPNVVIFGVEVDDF